MLEENLPKVELSYAAIAQYIRNIMGDDSKYDIEFMSVSTFKKAAHTNLVEKCGEDSDDETEDYRVMMKEFI